MNRETWELKEEIRYLKREINMLRYRIIKIDDEFRERFEPKRERKSDVKPVFDIHTDNTPSNESKFPPVTTCETPCLKKSFFVPPYKASETPIPFKKFQEESKPCPKPLFFQTTDSNKPFGFSPSLSTPNTIDLNFTIPKKV